MRSKPSVYALLIILLMLLGTVPVTLTRAYDSSNAITGYIVKPLDFRAIGVVGALIVGVEDGKLVAYNTYNGWETQLADLKYYGLNPQQLHFGKGDKYYIVWDNRGGLVFNGLNLVGRFAMDDMKGVQVMKDGSIVGWSKDIILYAAPPKYDDQKEYDAWGMAYNFTMNEVPAYRAVYWGGVDLSDILAKLKGSPNNTVVNFTVTYNFQSTDPASLRDELKVDVVTAGLVNDNIFVAMNIKVPVKVIAVIKINNGNTSSYDTREATFTVEYGLLAKINVYSDYKKIVKPHRLVEAGAASNIMAYVYRPLPGESLAPSLLMLIMPGRMKTIPLYTSAPIDKVLVAGLFVLVHDEQGVVKVYYGDNYRYGFIAGNLADASYSPIGLVVGFNNGEGVIEVGLLDYSGTFNKFISYYNGKIVGVSGLEDVIIASTENEAYFYFLNETARLEIYVTDDVGTPVRIINGIVSITFNGKTITDTFESNPAVFTVPVGARVTVNVTSMYGAGHASKVINSPGDHKLTVIVEFPVSPGNGEASTPALFSNPFSRSYVVVSDKSLPKITLPGAVSGDSEGGYVALLINRRNDYSRVALYSLTGYNAYTTLLPSVLSKVKMFGKYVVASSPNRIYVLGLLSGAVKATVMMKNNGYDIDVLGDYMTAWNSRYLAVVDLRSGLTRILDMSSYGVLLVAPVVNGVVFAYVESQSGGSVVVISASKQSVISVNPWDGVKVTGFYSDGVFHAVSYLTRRGSQVTDVISVYDGIVTIPSGPVVWVADLGSRPKLPSTINVRGARYAVVATKNASMIMVYVTGFNYDLLNAITMDNIRSVRFTMLYIAGLSCLPSPAITLYSYDGVPRLTMLLSSRPVFYTASDYAVVYGGDNATYIVQYPRQLGKYKIEVSVTGENGKPVDAVITVAETNASIRAVNGKAVIYVPTPGEYTLTIKADYYQAKTVKVRIGDNNPVASVNVRLEKQRYPLTVNVVDEKGNPVSRGEIIVEGVNTRFKTTIKLPNNTVVDVPVGSYKITFTSDVYTSNSTLVTVNKPVTVKLTVKRVRVHILFKVVSPEGTAIPEAKVIVNVKGAGTINASTRSDGTAEVLVPYGKEFVVRVYKKGYTPFITKLNATEELEGKPYIITLKRATGVLVITILNSEGKPAKAFVTIKNEKGVTVSSMNVAGSTSINLPSGVYTIIVTTPTGKPIMKTVTVNAFNKTEARIVLPKPPTPIYVWLFPVLLLVVIVLAVWMLWKKKSKPPEVPVVQ